MARQLIIELVGEASKLSKSLDQAGKDASGFGDKVGTAGKKMTAFVSVPIAGFLAGATKAAMDDAAAQAHLATTLETSIGKQQGLVEKVEGYITQAQKASTFTDDELRPAFETLARTTGDAEKSNDLLAIAMDVAAGKGISLETATLAVTKASEGNLAAANKLVPGLVDVKDETLGAEDATRRLAQMFDGQAKSATETTAGKMQNLKRDLGETSEKIGGALLPAMTSLATFLTDTLLPALDRISGGNGALVLLGVAAAGPVTTAVGSVTTAVGALNGALTGLAAHPVVLFLVSLALALKDVRDRFKEVKSEGASVENLLKGIPGSGLSLVMGGAMKLLGRASGGPVAGGNPYIVGEAGPELFVPGASGRIIPNGAGGGATNITVNVAGSVATEAQLTDAIHAGLLRKQRNTPLGIAS